MLTPNAHTESNPRTPQVRSGIVTKSLPVPDYQPGPDEITGRYVAKPQDPEKGMVVQSIRNGDQQTMPNMQETLDHRTVPPIACSMPDMRKKGNTKKTITIQTPRQPGGLDLQIGSPGRVGRGESGRRCSSLSGCHQEMFIKHVDGPRQGYPADKK